MRWMLINMRCWLLLLGQGETDEHENYKPTPGGRCSCRSITPPSFRTMADASSIEYDWLYTTSRTPHWTILTEHRRQGHLRLVSHGLIGFADFQVEMRRRRRTDVLQYKTESSPVLSRPASSKAFSSA